MEIVSGPFFGPFFVLAPACGNIGSDASHELSFEINARNVRAASRASGADRPASRAPWPDQIGVTVLSVLRQRLWPRGPGSTHQTSPAAGAPRPLAHRLSPAGGGGCRCLAYRRRGASGVHLGHCGFGAPRCLASPGLRVVRLPLSLAPAGGQQAPEPVCLPTPAKCTAARLRAHPATAASSPACRLAAGEAYSG